MFRVKKLYVFLLFCFFIISGISYLVYKYNNANKKSIDITAIVLSNKEFNSCFKGINYIRNRNICNKYKAIEIDIKNQGSGEYLLEKNGVNLDLEDSLDLKKKLLKIDFGILGLITGLGTGTLFALWSGLTMVPCAASIGAFGAMISSISIEKNGKRIRNSIISKSHDLVHGVLISAHQFMSMIFFIKKENLKKSFNVKLLDVNSKKYLDFTVNI